MTNPPPPPLPPESASFAERPPKKGLSTVAIVLIVVGSLFTICVVAGVIGTVAVVIPKTQDRQKRLTCQVNLSMLAGIHVMQAMENPDQTVPSGPALFLGWRERGVISASSTANCLVCPGDTAYDPTAPAGKYTSFAVRDFVRFPMQRDQAGGVLAACTHHLEGVNVVYDDGQVKFSTWADLGLTGPEEADVGPDAKSPLLRQVCRHPGVTEK